MLFPKPGRFFLCSGAAEGFTPLNAFDVALLRAGVGNTNLIRMSSILPPHVVLTEPVALVPGSFVPLAYAAIDSCRPGELISAAVAVAIPEDRFLPGVIMEHHDCRPVAEVEAQVRRMAEEAMVYRDYRVREVMSISAEHRVVKIGAAFAAVVLCE